MKVVGFFGEFFLDQVEGLINKAVVKTKYESNDLALILFVLYKDLIINQIY